jgi:capsular polysaccharide export protein
VFIYLDMIPVPSHHSTDRERPLILLLQGPVGPFFRRLHRSLIDRGFRVVKVNFNGGDLLFSPDDEAINFRGSPLRWKTWLRSFVAAKSPVAIVLFGDRRPYHVEALRVAHERKVATWCLEEGYIRPQYVTCERSGNNARSPLTQTEPRPQHFGVRVSRPVKNPMSAMATYAVFYAFFQMALTPLFHGNVRHRKRPIARECARWGLSLVRKLVFYGANRRAFREIVANRIRDYYVVALQVHDDLNLSQNGNGWTMERLIEETTRSFAQNAPKSHRLLFKVHPLDRGHLPYRKLIADAAHRHGCRRRVMVVDDRPIGPMIRNSDGVVTVNSTSGLIALQHAKPLAVLGNAVYSSAKLKTLPQALHELDLFWEHPIVARPPDVDSFFAQMYDESLVAGNFYLAAERQATADAVADRIHDDFVSTTLTLMLSALGNTDNRESEAGHERLAG